MPTTSRIRRRSRSPKRKPRRPLTAAQRRTKAPQIPRGVELFFMTALRAVARRFAAAVGRVIYPRIAEFAKPEEHTDAAPPPSTRPPGLAALMGKAKRAADDDLDSGTFRKAADLAAARTLKHSQKEFKRIGVKVLDEPKLGGLVTRWREANVARITGMHEDQLGKIEKLLREGQGMRVETLTKEIERQVEDVTTSRAEFLARDQVLTLNGQITKERQTAAGIEKYQWSTSNDSRVRDEHAELEGMTFSWDNPPEPGHPGEDYQCRCVAVPVLDELDADTE